jgi:nitronate monooxygenase
LLKTKFTDLTGCKVPIQQAGMGPIANPQLAAAVANAGALGMISDLSDEPRIVEKWLEETREHTKGIFGANYILNESFFPDLSIPREILDSIELASKIANVVEFFYRKPDASLVELVHKGGALAIWQVGSKDEARAAEDAGCDVIIAQGTEAGGHIRGKLGLLTILNEVLSSVNIPVLAAGGIGNGRAMASALAAGASGVRVGTRFAAAKESGAHPEYVQALIAADTKDTVIRDGSSNWLNAPYRVLRSSVEEAQKFKEGDVVGKRDPYLIGEWTEVHRFDTYAVTKETVGAIKAMSLFAGESVGDVRRVQSAADIIDELSREAEVLLRASASLLVS